MAFSLNQYSAGLAIVIFVGVIIYKYLKNESNHLSNLVIVLIAAGMLPLAIAFALYPFFPNLIGSLEEKSLQITITGLVLIFVYVKTIYEKINSDNS